MANDDGSEDQGAVAPARSPKVTQARVTTPVPAATRSISSAPVRSASSPPLTAAQQAMGTKSTLLSGDGAAPRPVTGAPLTASAGVHDTPDSGSAMVATKAQPEDPYLNKVVADRYRILSKLGEGGMGVVYLAEHVVIEKKVALKILSEDLARKGDLVARFMQEAKAASKIGHENIIDITDFGETPSGSVFFAMEFLDGADLAHFVKADGAMPFHRVRHIMNQVCRALGAAHSKGIIHRDLKPENIYLIEREGTADFVKILDFGIAKISSFDEGGGARLTRTGMIFGTPEYMSPEQARGDRPDHRVDIYAAGCILYELLTGDVPFSAETFMGVLTKHMFEPVQPPSERLPSAQVAPDVEAVVMKALAKDREQRYQTMKDMALALEACAGGDLAAAWGQEGSGVGLMSPRETSVRRAMAPKTPATTPVPHSATPVPGTVPPGADSLPPRSRWPLVLGATLGLAAVVGGGWATRSLWMGQPVQPKPVDTVLVAPVEKPAVKVDPVVPKPLEKPVEPPPVTGYKIEIHSAPAGAEVFRDLERLGATPVIFQLPAGSEKVTLILKKHGYKDFTATVVPDHNGVYDMPLQALSHKAGSTKPPAVVESRPTTPTTKRPEKDDSNGKLRDLKNPFPGN